MMLDQFHNLVEPHDLTFFAGQRPLAEIGGQRRRIVRLTESLKAVANPFDL